MFASRLYSRHLFLHEQQVISGEMSVSGVEVRKEHCLTSLSIVKGETEAELMLPGLEA